MLGCSGGQRASGQTSPAVCKQVGLCRVFRNKRKTKDRANKGVS